MTEKLYYRDAYMKRFSAAVISCEEAADGSFLIALDRTAFFPEAAGQYADTGTLGGARVFGAKETDGVIYHFTDIPLRVGESVVGEIAFDERYEKMQSHSAEHILSGIFHSQFGLENVGFHLGAEEVTMDISRPLAYCELMRAEELANEAVYKNIEITAEFPTPSELSAMEYRAKLDLKENVRIVRIGDYDACACCAPHVRYTGEIGLIKISDFTKLRGGMRLGIAAGRRAMRMFREYSESVGAVSSALSLPRADIAFGVKKLISDMSELRGEYKAYRLEAVRNLAVRLPATAGNAVVLLDGADAEELIAFSNTALSRVGGILVLLSGGDGNYKYVISSATVDLKGEIASINKSLLGRGGGKSGMVQGSFASTYRDIKAYFGV